MPQNIRNEAQEILNRIIPLDQLSDIQVATRLTLEAERFPECAIKPLALEAARRLVETARKETTHARRAMGRGEREGDER